MRTMLHHRFIRLSAYAVVGLVIGAQFAMSDARADGDPARGAVLSKTCASCHGEAGKAPIDGYPLLSGQKLRRQKTHHADHTRHTFERHHGSLCHKLKRPGNIRRRDVLQHFELPTRDRSYTYGAAEN